MLFEHLDPDVFAHHGGGSTSVCRSALLFLAQSIHSARLSPGRLKAFKRLAMKSRYLEGPMTAPQASQNWSLRRFKVVPQSDTILSPFWSRMTMASLGQLAAQAPQAMHLSAVFLKSVAVGWSKVQVTQLAGHPPPSCRGRFRHNDRSAGRCRIAGSAALLPSPRFPDSPVPPAER